MTEQGSRERIVAQQMLLARECLDDAAAAASRESSRLAWNRAYSACFHAATAVFVARNRRFRKHRGIIKAVHEELVPEGFVGPEQAVAFEGLYAQKARCRLRRLLGHPSRAGCKHPGNGPALRRRDASGDRRICPQLTSADNAR